jgi:hypothetical protein
MTQPIGNIPAQTPFDDPDTKLPSSIWVRWLQKLISLPEPPTTYVPVVTSGSGAFTTVSATGRYRKIGKLVFVQITVTITTNGTAGTLVSVSLPFASVNLAGVQHCLTGKAASVSGKALTGIIVPNSNVALVLNYDNSYPGSSGETLVLNGFYETT